jgi:hypothetical protein
MEERRESLLLKSIKWRQKPVSTFVVNLPPPVRPPASAAPRPSPSAAPRPSPSAYVESSIPLPHRPIQPATSPLVFPIHRIISRLYPRHFPDPPPPLLPSCLRRLLRSSSLLPVTPPSRRTNIAPSHPSSSPLGEMSAGIEGASGSSSVASPPCSPRPGPRVYLVQHLMAVAAAVGAFNPLMPFLIYHHRPLHHALSPLCAGAPCPAY